MRNTRALCRGILIAAITVPAIVADARTGPVSAAARGAHYVALGDSYSSGLGAGKYEGSSGNCERSADAYPNLWAARNAAASFTSVACANATTLSVRTRQVPALRAGTTVVSLTVGGNDADFGGVMRTCLLETDSACLGAISRAESFIAGQLPARLNMTLQAIHAHARSARIVVLGYPDLYDLSKSRTCLGLSTVKRTSVDHGIDRLDGAIAAAAARSGDTFSDVRRYFSGHEICDSSSWLHSLWFPLSASYHPTAAGQERGYLRAFAAAAG